MSKISKHSLFFILLCLGASLQADIILDQVMTRDDQRKTGVVNLSANQKIALEAWLNQNFVLKTQDQAPTQTALMVSININNGQQLQLSDNSVWAISPDDVATAAIWITPVPIAIKQSNNLDYPALLVNTNDGVSVKAKRVTPAMTNPAAYQSKKKNS